MNALEACLFLRYLPGIGPVKEQKLLSHFKTPSAIFDASESDLLKIEGLGSIHTKAIQNWRKYKPHVQQQIDLIAKHQIKTLFWGAENYPETLAFCPDAPAVLFYRGNLDVARKRKIISVVGTRSHTRYGEEMCKMIIQNLAPYDPIICSGFAYGIDIVAHKAALANGLNTIACLAHGFNTLYPKEHKKYQNQIEKQGAFFSDCLFGETIEKGSFPRRNRIIAGLGHLTLVIESASKGGSMNTADLANQYGREIFALPGKVSDAKSRGCNLLIKQQKATLFFDIEQLLESLQLLKESKPKKPTQRKLFISLTEEEQKVFAAFQDGERKHLDLLAAELKWEIGKVASLLMILEMKGLILAHQGKYFEVI